MALPRDNETFKAFFSNFVSRGDTTPSPHAIRNGFVGPMYSVGRIFVPNCIDLDPSEWTEKTR